MELQYEKMGNDMKLDILNNKLNNKKSEIEREKQIRCNNIENKLKKKN